ncbi:hypothetical protein ACIGKQ_16450 [Gordonia sp. NPDC062954]|uniref:hypothetical protein n=1 Tax=Gordonia sp. NPDC062954 TaxID=3364003 RepID=UPI0037C805D9
MSQQPIAPGLDDARRAAALILAVHRDDADGQREILAATAESGRPLELIIHLAHLAHWLAPDRVTDQLTAYLRQLAHDEANS